MTSAIDIKTNVLDELVKINQDRVQCYRDASYNTTESDLKYLFCNNANESRKNITDLNKIIWSAPNTYSLINNAKRGKIYEAWLATKSELKGKSFYQQLTCCESVELAVLKAYLLVNIDSLTTNVAELVQRQLELLKVAYDVLVAYKNSYAKMEMLT